MEEHSQNSLSCGLKRKTRGRLGWGWGGAQRLGVGSQEREFHHLVLHSTGRGRNTSVCELVFPSLHATAKRRAPLSSCINIYLLRWNGIGSFCREGFHSQASLTWVHLPGLADPLPRASHTTAVSSRSSLRDSACPPGTRGQVWGSQWNKTERRVKPRGPGDASTKRGKDSSEVKPVGVRTQSRISWPQWWWLGAGSFFVACVRVEGPVLCHGGG